MANAKYLGRAALTYIRLRDGRVSYVERGEYAPATAASEDLERLAGLGFLIEEPAEEFVTAVALNTQVLASERAATQSDQAAVAETVKVPAAKK
jgi:hypothetical protein